MTRNELQDEYVTREEAARLLGVNVRTVDRYAEQGLLQRYLRLARIVYVRRQVEELSTPVPYDPPAQLQAS